MTQDQAQTPATEPEQWDHVPGASGPKEWHNVDGPCFGCWCYGCGERIDDPTGALAESDHEECFL